MARVALSELIHMMVDADLQRVTQEMQDRQSSG
jgi:hypothetical protein